MTTTISAAQGASTAAPSTETEITLPSELAMQLQSEFSHHTQDRLEQECRNLVMTTALAAIELGKRLLFIKETVGHGNWLLTLQRIGIGYRFAQKMMAVAVRILSLPDHARLIAAAKNKTKLNELLVLDDEELYRLNQGESVRGVSLGTLPQNSVATLRSMLRNNAPEAATAPVKQEQVPVAPPSTSALLGDAAEVAAGHQTTAPFPFSGHIDPGAEPLEQGDRVQSRHAGRPGRVVRTYRDGSACVCWDDGEPQPEGLGHERVPRQLLIRVSQEEAGKASITREEAMLISEALIASLRKNGAKRLLAVEDTVEMMLANGVIQCECVDPTTGETSTASIGTIISNLRIYGLHPDQLLSPESDGDEAELRAILDTQAKAYAKAHDVSYAEAVGAVFGEAGAVLLSGEPSETTAPFSGRIDPGNDLHVGHRPAVPDRADDLQALPSVYSMTHGNFDGADMTLMIHAGKTWMIAEEIAAVLGETPEQVAEIEGIIDHHFTLAKIPEAYAKVRIASTALTARLLDADAIHLLDVVLDTPASSALVAWMKAKTDDATEASPLPTSDESTLSQNFSQLEVLHGIAWDMMDQLASQIGALRVVLMEQESDPGPVAKAVHPETLAEVAANLLAEHNDLCDDMGRLTRDIHQRVFEKSESLPESVWLDLVVELSKERDALLREEMWKISCIATNLLRYAHSSPEVGAALGNLVEYSRRHGANLYRHEPTGTMTWQWLQEMNPALRKNASRQAH